MQASKLSPGDVLSKKQQIKGDFPHALYHLSIWIDFPIRNYGVLSYYELLFELSIFVVELM